MERAILYVDGFNFYYGVTKHWWGKNKDLAGLGWCDFHALIERHFHLGDAQLEIKYFTAPVHFENNEEHKRYAVWARAVRTIAGIRVMEGFYKPKSRPDPATKSREEKQSDVNLAVEVMLDALGPTPPRKVYLLSDDRDLMPVVFALRERVQTPIEFFVLLPSRADPRNWQESYRGTAQKLMGLRPTERDQIPMPTVELLTEGMLASSLLSYTLQDSEGKFDCLNEWRLGSEYLERRCMTPEWRPDPPPEG